MGHGPPLPNHPSTATASHELRLMRHRGSGEIADAYEVKWSVMVQNR